MEGRVWLGALVKSQHLKPSWICSPEQKAILATLMISLMQKRNLEELQGKKALPVKDTWTCLMDVELRTWPEGGIRTYSDGCPLICEITVWNDPSEEQLGSLSTLPPCFKAELALPFCADVAERPASGRAGILINWPDHITLGDKRARMSCCSLSGEGGITLLIEDLSYQVLQKKIKRSSLYWPSA